MGNLETSIKSLPCDEQEYLKRYFANAPDWLIDSFQILNVPAETAFVEEGEEANSIYILLKGRVRAIDYRVFDIVYRHYVWYPVEVFGAMEIIGEMDLYMATLDTLDDCVMLKASRKIYERWLNEDLNAYRMQASRIERYLLKQVRKERLNVLLSGTERVAVMLLRLYELYAENETTTICISRKEFVETTGLSERTVTRILKDYEAKGMISRKGWDVVMTFEQYEKIKESLGERIDESSEQ